MSEKYQEIYTDAPKKWNNLFLGCFQLLYWIFFKPSAWRNYVQATNNNHKLKCDICKTGSDCPDILKYDFCLTQLKPKDWKKSGLWRVFVQGYIILPILSACLIGFFLLLLELSVSGEPRIISYDINLWYVIAGSLGFSLAGGVAFGTVNSTIVGVASSVLFAIAGSIAFYYQEFDYINVIIWCLMVGIVSNIIITFYLEKIVSEKELSSFFEKFPLVDLIPKIFIGFFIGAIGVAILIGIPLWIIEPTETSIAIAVLTSLSIIAIFLSCSKNNYEYLIVGVIIIAYSLFAFTKEGFFGGLGKGIVYGTFVGACISVPYFTITHKITEDKTVIASGMLAATLAVSLIWGFLSGLLYGNRFLYEMNAESTNLIWDTIPFIIAGFIAALCGLSFSWWRSIVFFPFIAMWHTLIYLIDDKQNLKTNKPSLLRYHAAFWDELQWIKLTRLVDHILLVMEKNPTEAEMALQYLQNKRQKWVVDEVKMRQDIRTLEKLQTIDAIGELDNTFEPKTRIGNRFKEISNDFNEACQQFTIHNQIVALTNVKNSINSLILRELERTDFKNIAEIWYKLVSQHKDSLRKKVKELKQIESPYIFASPLGVKQTNFVGRTDIVNELQDLLFQQNVSVFLQGTYRIGKTSLLMNLRKLLSEPDKVIALLVDLQGAAAIGNNVKEFFYQIAEEMKQSAEKNYDVTLPSLPLDELDDKPYDDFDKWLDKVQKILGSKTLLLMFDEFAKLDEVIREKKSDYSKDILDAMRHWIQHRENFQIVMTSQRMEEFNRWSSIVNNMVLKHIGSLTEKEARQLIEHPVKDFQLKYKPGAVRRILELTHCHPALIQLLCREIVVFKNKQNLDLRFLVKKQEIEAAIPSALETGQSIFVTFKLRATDVGNALLHYIASLGSGKIVEKEQLAQNSQGNLEATLEILQDLELLEQAESGYRFRVEMFRLWYVK
jgi:hypothetical protein